MEHFTAVIVTILIVVVLAGAVFLGNGKNTVQGTMTTSIQNANTKISNILTDK